jgi:phosphoribosylformylglycinamidine cyclo-ligase
MEKTFNMGVGMVAVLPADDVDRALAVLTARHVPSWVLGAVRRAAEPPPEHAAPGARVRLQGDHPRF